MFQYDTAMRTASEMDAWRAACMFAATSLNTVDVDEHVTLPSFSWRMILSFNDSVSPTQRPALIGRC